MKFLEKCEDQILELREALMLFLEEYEVNGKIELHDRNCLYRKIWALDEALEDEVRCIAARAALGYEELLPYRIIGYTAEECERDMRKMTNGKRGCSNPDEHIMSRFTGHMEEEPD